MDWPEHKRRRKDVDARWTERNGKLFYGYKNHIAVDVKHKLIRGYAVTDAGPGMTAKCSGNFFPRTRARNPGGFGVSLGGAVGASLRGWFSRAYPP